jgi:hypothetical protein
VAVGAGVATTTTTDQNVGNLVIDLFEGSSKQILWRGLATENLSSNDARNPKSLIRTLQKCSRPFPQARKVGPLLGTFINAR